MPDHAEPRKPSHRPVLSLKRETLKNLTEYAKSGGQAGPMASAVSECGCNTNGTNQAQCCA